MSLKAARTRRRKTRAVSQTSGITANVTSASRQSMASIIPMIATRVNASPKIGHDPRGEQLVERFHVGGHPGHQPAHRVSVEVADAEALQVRVDLHPEVVHDALSDVRHEQRAPVFDGEVEQERRQVQSGQETEQAHVVLGHGHVERVLGEARTDQGQCRLRQQQRDGDPRQPAVRTQVAQQAAQQRAVVPAATGVRVVGGLAHVAIRSAPGARSGPRP